MATTPQQGETKLARTTFPAMLEKFKSEIARALPRHMNPDRMLRIALTEFRKNPKLAECDPRSVFAACIVASQLGLEPGVMGQAYLIPYKSECQLIPGYQGLLDLVRRSGFVQRVEAHVVHHGDKFTYKTGLHTILEHEPLLEGIPGPLRFAYAVAEFKDGGYHVEVMTEDQINKIRDRSQGYQNAKKYNRSTPWETDTEEMWRKTVLRRISKFLPKSPEMTMALSLDDAAAQGRQAISVQDAIEGTWQAPVIEVSTEDPLAEKSRANLEELKERYAQSEAARPTGELQRDLRVAPDPAKQEQLRAEAERQKRDLEEYQKLKASGASEEQLAEFVKSRKEVGAGQPEATPSKGDSEVPPAAAALESAAPPNVPQPTGHAAAGPAQEGASSTTLPSAPETQFDPELLEQQADRQAMAAEEEQEAQEDWGQHGLPGVFNEPQKGKSNRKR